MIKLSSESLDKIHRVLRSLFRYAEFQNNSYPKILIEQEAKIINDIFKELNSEEIFYAFNLWPEFFKKQIVEQELDNNVFASIMKKELDSLN
jgi:hypothetical protein